MCKKLIKKYEDCDRRRLYEIVTGDETWIKFSEPERKERSKAWLPKNSIPLTKPRPDFREEKVLYSIFFDAYGPVAQIPVPKGGKMNGDFYSSKCLREVEDFTKPEDQALALVELSFSTIMPGPMSPSLPDKL